MIPQIETARLLLRGWRNSDLDGFAATMAEPEVAEFLTLDRRPLDRAGAWREMAIFAGQWALDGFGLFVVEERASGAFVGRVGLWRPDNWPGVELGWGLRREFWGRGLAFEAASAARDWAFARRLADRLVSVIHVDNARSARLAERLGMRAARATLHAGMAHTIWEVAREAA